MRAHGPVSSIALCVLLTACSGSVPSAADPRLDVRFVTDEPEAVLAILDARAAGRVPSTDDWSRLFESEGYRRLQAREASLGRGFSDSSFRAFVESDSLLLRREALSRTLEAWKRLDPEGAAARAFDYLPPGSRVQARIYPSIKPRENSFVFEPRENPAIFLFLDPAVTPAKLENILAHELHHIGIAGACPSEPNSDLPPGLREAVDWMGGFAEGIAVLAAAGGSAVHPHASSDSAERAVWDRDIGQAATDVQRLEGFFTDLMDRRLTEEEALRIGFTFVNTGEVPQGAFYTVGWLMAATVERELGGDRLVDGLCDSRRLILDYEEAAERIEATRGMTGPRWSAGFVARLRNAN